MYVKTILLSFSIGKLADSEGSDIEILENDDMEQETRENETCEAADDKFKETQDMHSSTALGPNVLCLVFTSVGLVLFAVILLQILDLRQEMFKLEQEIFLLKTSKAAMLHDIRDETYENESETAEQRVVVEFQDQLHSIFKSLNEEVKKIKVTFKGRLKCKPKKNKTVSYGIKKIKINTFSNQRKNKREMKQEL